ncbi:substrate-binding domain-containing protein [Pseudonocardia sp. CA-107938]|uniref:substrate-binding domain-containing protein n=1 Tax=Pseudonocardia sp. CA-107938 TaxID=3240021 RepID=UPI003D8AA546
MRSIKVRVAVGVAAAAAVALLGACSANAPAPGNGAAGADGSFKVGLLLPETAVARYEGRDRPYFEAALKQQCPGCQFLYSNANSSAATQQQQAQSMLTQGANVLVVDPVDGKAAASIVSAAASRKVPVVAYDRLIDSPDLAYVVSNDYEQVGRLQAQSLVDKLKADGVALSAGGVLMMNGASTDFNAGLIKRGAMSVLEQSGYPILSSIDTWDPDVAQNWVAGQITRFGKRIVGFYSANDGNAGAAIAAARAGGLTPLPPSTGLDASVAGLQSILVGDQYMTTYNAFQKEANTAVTVALQLARGEKPNATTQLEGRPASINAPVAVTRSNIASTVLADGFYTAADICVAQYQQACAAAGIR